MGGTHGRWHHGGAKCVKRDEGGEMGGTHGRGGIMGGAKCDEGRMKGGTRVQKRRPSSVHVNTVRTPRGAGGGCDEGRTD